MSRPESPEPPTVVDVVVDQSRRVLQTYRVDAGLIQEHANNERRIAQGGYGDRQIFELVQNAADELRDSPGGEIAVVLTTTHLYCANEGNPVTPEGAETILRMSMSRKRGGQIGRFGVGVKSVLEISDAPQFFSKAGGAEFGFGFDREWSAEMIRDVHPDAVETPVLRMAQHLDPARLRAADPVLDDLMRWATTVVRLPLKPQSVSSLVRDINNFPVEFPLFSPHVGTVTLEDRHGGHIVTRQIFQLPDGARRRLQEVRRNDVSIDHEWLVFTRTHRPSDSALRAAGELHDRPEIDISWAVPEQSGSRGTFWAYFPTKFATTLRGILNAPWKTSEDRQAIFDGNAFNDELIQVAAELVVDSLPKLSNLADPAGYIDYLPGRGREAPQFADERLTKAIWATAAQRCSLVDQNGVLRKPGEVRIQPESLREEWLKLWAGYEGRPVDWVHHSAERRERRARVSLILDRAGQPESSVRQWLEALVEDGSSVASATAIRIVSGMVESGHPLFEEALCSRIVLTESHGMVAPVRGKVFRRSTADDLRDDIVYVAEDVLDGFGVTSALEILGVREADAPGRFAAVVDQGFHDYAAVQWCAFWELSRAAGSIQSLDVLRVQSESVRSALKVRTVAGHFRLLHDCLLPGSVVPSDGSRYGGIAVDLDFHTDDKEVLAGLGLLEQPALDQDPQNEPWFEVYREAAWEAYLRRLDDKDPRPQKKTMRVDGPNPAGPLRFLDSLSPEGCAAFLQNVPSRGLVTRWTVQVGSRQQTRRKIKSPLVWMARRRGYLETSRGLTKVPSCVGPALAEYAEVLPIARIPELVADALELSATLEKVPAAVWAAAVAEASESEDDAFAGKVYALLLEADAAWPDGAMTRCRIGDTWSSDVEDSDIAVTAVRAEYDALVREGVPALLVPSADAADRMVESWGMLTPAQVIEKEIRFVAESEPVALLDQFPHLRMIRRDLDGWSLTRCSELEEITRTPHGMRTATLRQTVQEHSVLVLRPNDEFEALLAVDSALGLGLGPTRCCSVLEQRRKQRENERRQAVRRAQTEEAKILRLIGEEQLRAGLPPGLEEAEKATTGHEPTGERLARLAIDAYGASVLRHYNKDVATRNEDAPRSFSGSTASRRFVAELGLPESYAGSAAVTSPEMEEVNGPSEYPRLHQYQERVTDRMVELLSRPVPGRAMLRLPTGAGKTRVAVEAVIRVVRTRGLAGPILWIAQSEELCEQAVQSWRFVWSKVGPEETLTVNRFWGGNDAAPVTDNTQLVVTTDAKLDSNLVKDEYAWLHKASVVIVDEAHRAISPRYTAILEQLGLTRSRTERPLVGLTATPFRGTNEDETERLVRRFGGYRLDEGLFLGDDPHGELQSIGVLAKVDHRELQGSTLTLNEAEFAKMDESGGFLPSSAEERLGQDRDRNEMLLDEVAGLGNDWPVLLFATSVNHSKLLTAMLNGRGITSASIDSFTPLPERRNKIDAFRRDRIRVITNYGVLAQGFDAPATRAVVIARPTYSPNVYQQMIGRGLRGPENGGEERCLILDVHDNIENYGKSLAFTGFEHLWGIR